MKTEEEMVKQRYFLLSWFGYCWECKIYNGLLHLISVSPPSKTPTPTPPPTPRLKTYLFFLTLKILKIKLHSPLKNMGLPLKNVGPTTEEYGSTPEDFLES